MRKIKLNRILTKYPLIWNTRVLIILPLSILINLLFYLDGYSTNTGFSYLSQVNMRDDEDVTAFGVLLTSLILIFWMVFYFRNNAFKSFYPLKRGHLILEYFIIFITILVTSTFPVSHRKGVYDKIRHSYESTDLGKEANLINLAYNFLPFSSSEFHVTNCCDSIKSRRARNADTYYEYSDEDTLENRYSLLYYCKLEHTPETDSSYMDLFQIHATVERYLANKQKDTIELLLKEFLSRCVQYGGEYHFNAESHTENCLKNQFPTGYIYEERNDDEPLRIFIESWDYRTALTKIDESREGFFHDNNYELPIVYLYYILAFSVLIFTFRITKLRTWFIALIALGVWLVVFILFASLFREPEWLFYLFLILYFGFFIFAMLNILGRTEKLFSGIAMLWSIWVFPGIMPAIFAFIAYKLRPLDYYDYERKGDVYNDIIIEPPHPLYLWIQGNWDTIAFTNVALVILVLIFVMIPLARKWQANPEE